MTEIVWLIEAARTLLDGAPLEPLFERPGFVSTMVWLAVVVPASLIALGIGLHDWGDTPLGQWFGAAPGEPARTAGEIDADLRKYETWRDFDGDGEADF